MHNTNIPCGCLIEYEGDQTHQDYSIDWCLLHAAASDMLETLKELENSISPTPAHWEKARTIIAKATGA